MPIPNKEVMEIRKLDAKTKQGQDFILLCDLKSIRIDYFKIQFTIALLK